MVRASLSMRKVIDFDLLEIVHMVIVMVDVTNVDEAER